MWTAYGLLQAATSLLLIGRQGHYTSSCPHLRRKKERKTYARCQACVKGALASKSHRAPVPTCASGFAVQYPATELGAPRRRLLSTFSFQGRLGIIVRTLYHAVPQMGHLVSLA